MVTNSRFYIIVGLVVIAALSGAFLVLNRPESADDRQSTDDAYIQADFTVVAPQIAGVIKHIDVADHQSVRAGDPLLNIDDRDLRIAAGNAQAQIAGAQAVIDSLQAQIVRQRSMIEQAKAALDADDAGLKLAEADRNRFANLARDGSGTLQAQQQAEARWKIQLATRERDLAGERSTEQQIAIMQADLGKAQADLIAAQAKKADAELNLSYAHVVAPIGGVVAQRRARVGGYVQVGEPLLTLVPMDALYIEANFRETQLARVQVGQPVIITADALPGIQFKGEVESLGPASGVSFSSVPPHNATGNFTKIVQRLPVRIRLDPNQTTTRQLRVGMSVHPSIDVNNDIATQSRSKQGAGRAIAPL